MKKPVSYSSVKPLNPYNKLQLILHDMMTIRKILYSFLLIAFAINPIFAKPADIQAARTFLKPFQTFGNTSRPIRAEEYLSPSGHFLIHYDNSGYNEVPQDFTYNDSIPDS